MDKVYTPMAERESAVKTVESFREFVMGIVEPMTRDHRDAREMLDSVDWEKLRAYYIAERV